MTFVEATGLVHEGNCKRTPYYVGAGGFEAGDLTNWYRKLRENDVSLQFATKDVDEENDGAAWLQLRHWGDVDKLHLLNHAASSQLSFFVDSGRKRI